MLAPQTINAEFRSGSVTEGTLDLVFSERYGWL
jgi:hypothetical protein